MTHLNIIFTVIVVHFKLLYLCSSSGINNGIHVYIEELRNRNHTKYQDRESHATNKNLNAKGKVGTARVKYIQEVFRLLSMSGKERTEERQRSSRSVGQNS